MGGAGREDHGRKLAKTGGQGVRRLSASRPPRPGMFRSLRAFYPPAATRSWFSRDTIAPSSLRHETGPGIGLPPDVWTSAVCASDARELGLDRGRTSGLFRPVSAGGPCRGANPWRHRARDVEAPRNGRAGGAASSSRTRARPKPGRHIIAGPTSLGGKPALGLLATFSPVSTCSRANTYRDLLFGLSQIGIGSGEPVLPRRTEDVDVERCDESFCSVR
jgi:hypothetical protein